MQFLVIIQENEPTATALARGTVQPVKQTENAKIASAIQMMIVVELYSR